MKLTTLGTFHEVEVVGDCIAEPFRLGAAWYRALSPRHPRLTVHRRQHPDMVVEALHDVAGGERGRDLHLLSEPRVGEASQFAFMRSKCAHVESLFLPGTDPQWWRRLGAGANLFRLLHLEELVCQPHHLVVRILNFLHGIHSRPFLPVSGTHRRQVDSDEALAFQDP